MVRTQIYLDDNQRLALKMLAASKDQNVSDIVRRAIDRLLADEFTGKDWATEMESVVERLRAAGPELSDDEINAAIATRRVRKQKVSA